MIVLIDYFGINCSKNNDIANYYNNRVIIDKSHTFLNNFKHQYNQSFFFIEKIIVFVWRISCEFSKSEEKKSVERFFNQIVELQKEKARYIKKIIKSRNISYELSLIERFEKLEKNYFQILII